MELRIETCTVKRPSWMCMCHRVLSRIKKIFGYNAAVMRVLFLILTLFVTVGFPQTEKYDRKFFVQLRGAAPAHYGSRFLERILYSRGRRQNQARQEHRETPEIALQGVP